MTCACPSPTRPLCFTIWTQDVLQDRPPSRGAPDLYCLHGARLSPKHLLSQKS